MTKIQQHDNVENIKNPLRKCNNYFVEQKHAITV